MPKTFVTWVNVALLATSACAAGYLINQWDQLRPYTMEVDQPPDCGKAIDDDAYYLALICQGVINAKGSLPRDPVEAARFVAENASKLRFTWPNNFKINAAGEICDCTGQPFKIVVMSDRVAVTSASLFGIYFAELKKSSPESHKQ